MEIVTPSIDNAAINLKNAVETAKDAEYAEGKPLTRNAFLTKQFEAYRWSQTAFPLFISACSAYFAVHPTAASRLKQLRDIEYILSSRQRSRKSSSVGSRGSSSWGGKSFAITIDWLHHGNRTDAPLEEFELRQTPCARRWRRPWCYRPWTMRPACRCVCHQTGRLFPRH